MRKTETVASSENSRRKSTRKWADYNNTLNSCQINIHFPTGKWLCHIITMFLTVKVEFSINTVELEVKYLYNHLNAAVFCLCTSATQFTARTNHRPQKWDGNTTKYWRLAHSQNYKKIAILFVIPALIVALAWRDTYSITRRENKTVSTEMELSCEA